MYQRSIFVGFTVFVFVITTIFIANIHQNIPTPKYSRKTYFMANNTFCLNKVQLNFRKLYESICSVKDTFNDLSEAIEYIESQVVVETKSKKSKRIAEFFRIRSMDDLNVLDRFNMEITQNELYSNDSSLVDELLHEMATRQIIKVGEKYGGTQFKLKIQFDNEMFAIAKPMRFPRDVQTVPNSMQYAEFERHTAEIAAFHLDRILGFRRAMPVTGRILNMTSEIIALAKPNLTDTFFISPHPDNNHCLIGNCEQYCSIYHPICGKKDTLEVALVAYMPVYFNADDFVIEEHLSPWRRSYSHKRKAVWERDPKYCDGLKTQDTYKNGRRLLDLMDLAVFDFLTGNRDRHSYSTLKCLGSDAFFLHFDNGRGFGRPFFDDILNLFPIMQCCMIRSSTLKKLLSFRNGPKPLSQLMRESLARDPITPILWEPHLAALDRRVNIILTKVRECIEHNAIENVIYPRDNFGERTEQL